MGGFCLGGFCPRGDFVQGHFVQGDFVPGDYVWGDFVLEPLKNQTHILFSCILQLHLTHEMGKSTHK